jgi:MHS family citrate/tricarballylate:H+ symporter-like MFS transporter
MPARPGFGKELKLSAADSLIVTLLVAVTNFIWNPVGAALSDRIGRKPVLLTIACLSLVTAYPALHWPRQPRASASCRRWP